MILKITQKAAQLLAIQDAKRAMKACDYDGVSFSCRDTFADYRYEGLGDVLILNPKAKLEADVVEHAEGHGLNWRAAVRATGLDADAYLYRDRSADPYLPWQIIDGGLKEPFFRQEFEKSRRGEWTLPPKRRAENARLLPVLDAGE